VCFQPPIETRDADNKYLEPPERDKQFLISPPASPPVGWEVIGEREPAINYDLINAIARMGPGVTHILCITLLLLLVFVLVLVLLVAVPVVPMLCCLPILRLITHMMLCVGRHEKCLSVCLSVMIRYCIETA